MARHEGVKVVPDWLAKSWVDLRSCEVIGPFMGDMEPPKLTLPQDLFDDLVASIVYQQLSGKAAATIHSRFLALFGESGKAKPAELSQMSVETLRSVGLSRQKAAYVTDLATRVEQGILPLDHIGDLTEEELHAHLTQVKGIGPWTADMMLIFSLHRPDVFPVLDLGVKRGLQRALGRETDIKPKEMEEIGLRWKPYRSAASLALWRIADITTPGPA